MLRLDAARPLAAHWSRAEIAPFKTGATGHVPPRRELSTFAPLDGLDWQASRPARGCRASDSVREVVIRDAVPDLGRYLVDIRPA